MSDFETAAALETPLHYFLGRTSGDSTVGGVVIREAPALGHLVLRGNPDDQEFARGVESVVGVGLPQETGAFERSGDVAIYCLGPNEWLVIVPGGTEGDTESRLRQVLSGHFSVVDVSSGQALVNLSGSFADRMLKKSCVYDFSPTNFKPGHCVQTTFAKATALVAKNSDGTFDLVFRRSFADYLAVWLLDAGAEYGCRIDD